jgi:hypothetical protein
MKHAISRYDIDVAILRLPDAPDGRSGDTMEQSKSRAGPKHQDFLVFAGAYFVHLGIQVYCVRTVKIGHTRYVASAKKTLLLHPNLLVFFDALELVRLVILVYFTV